MEGNRAKQALSRLPDDAQEAERQNRNIFSEEKRDSPQPKQATVTKYAIAALVVI